jgi:hypothetical protein
MTYRNDHDAALARIDSLEQELEAMKAAPKPAPVVPANRYAWKIGIVASAAAAVLGGAWVVDRAHTRAPLRASAPAVAVPIFASVDDFRPCVTHVLAAQGDGFDAQTTDPRHGGRSVAPIEAVGAPCRNELARLIRDDVALTRDQRVAFQRWLAAEDTLAGDLSRIVVYYTNDPYQLDNYATATQLWHEYNVDRGARDATLPAVVHAMGMPNS